MNAAAITLAAQAITSEIEASTGEKFKSIARIDNWSEWRGHLIGQVSQHLFQNDFHSPYQMTTKIVARGEGWVETENTRYILGRPA